MNGAERYVGVAPGVRLRVRVDEGPAGAPAVVLVNGLMMAIEAWQGLTDELTRDHRVVRYDMRGQGKSDDPPGPHRVETNAEDLVAIVEALELDRFHLVGLSSGAPAAIVAAAELAAERPERILSLTSADGFVRLDPHLRMVVQAWLSAHEVGGPAHRFDVATPWVWGQAFLRDHVDELAGWRTAAAVADPGRAQALIAGMAAFDGDAGPALATLRCPVLALHGEDDVMTPARHGRVLLTHAADGRLVTIAEAGHASPIEQPTAVARALRTFWAETSDEPPPPVPGTKELP